ncbi:MAG: NFACT family protein, partial [Candidatus Ranarchaeia archaeon]
MQVKATLSNMGLAAIASELQLQLVGGRINNIYQLDKNLFLLKIHIPGKTIFLIVELGVRIHLTNYQYTVPTRPNNKTMVLRTHLRGSKITAVSQHNLDRILVLDTQRGTEKKKIIIEIFGKGNLTIVDEEGL